MGSGTSAGAGTETTSSAGRDCSTAAGDTQFWSKSIAVEAVGAGSVEVMATIPSVSSGGTSADV